MSKTVASSVPTRVKYKIERTRSREREATTKEHTIDRLFNKFDPEKKGYLDKAGLKSFIEYLGMETDITTFHEFANTFGGDQERVTKKRFAEVLGQMDQKYQKQQKTLRALFDEYDRDNSGAIDRRDVKALLKSMTQHASAETIEKLAEQFSGNPEGEITFEEFERWVLYREEEVKERDLFYKIFDKYDTTGNRHLSAAELDKFLADLGPRLRPGERHVLARKLAREGAGTSHVAFANSLTELHRQREAFEEAVAELFDECDPEGDGFISEDKIPLLMKKLGVKCSQENLTKFLKKYDTDGDKQLSYTEFRGFCAANMAKGALLTGK